MGVYIKGMKMPTHCIDCPFMVSRDNDDCILQSAEANENFDNWEQMKAGCPLAPVPPHGRLIDADVTNKILSLLKDLTSTEDYMGIGYNHGVVDSMTTIKNAPTIIEAEVSE